MLLAQQPVRNLSNLWTVTASGLGAAKRVFALIDTAPRIVDAPVVTTSSRIATRIPGRRFFVPSIHF